MKFKLMVGVAALFASAGFSHAQTYSGAGFAINDLAANSGTIAVAGATMSITDVQVVIYGLRHTWFNDLICSVTAPNGDVLNLFSRINTGDDPNGTYRFTDSALAAVSATDISGGTFLAQGGSFAARFGGDDANGTWQLNVNDVQRLDLGSIDGWEITVVPAPGAAVRVGRGGVLASRRRRG